MSRNPVKAGLSSTVEKGISLMVKHGVGSIIVVDSDNVPRGILTERELLRDIANHGRVSSDKPLNEVMSKLFLAINPLTTVQDAAKQMTKSGRRLVVTKKNGELFGVVSTSNLLRFFNKTARDTGIEQVLSRKVVTMDSAIGLLGAIKVMKEKRIGSVVVTDYDLPSGIVTERDLLKVLAKRRKKGFGSVRLKEIVSKPLISAAYGIKAREASSIMLGNKIKRLPLFRGQKLVAMLTAKDLVTAYCDSMEEKQSKRKVIRMTREKTV